MKKAIIHNAYGTFEVELPPFVDVNTICYQQEVEELRQKQKNKEKERCDDGNIEDMQQQIAKHNKLLQWALSLEKEKIDFLMDSGFYNNAVKGYLIEAARNAQFDDEQIRSLKNGLRLAFDNIGKKEAEEIYRNF